MEWPVVFLVDMDGYPRPGTTVAELLEERRLIFVGSVPIVFSVMVIST